MEYSVVGKRLPQIDGVPKATGQAVFSADMSFPAMLAGKILRSPHPHARILNIDASRALKLPGVRAVVTGKDTAGITYGFYTPRPINDEFGLAVDKVRYLGEQVAAVAAVDEDTASEGLELIEVEYELLPPVFDPEQAMQPDAPVVHDGKPNVSLEVNFASGDVDAAFARSDHLFEDKYIVQGVCTNPMESHAALACYDDSGKLTVWCTTQAPHYVREALARTLQMPLGRIRVIKPMIGGGFGGKREMLGLDFCASLLAKRTRRPVKIVHSREEEFQSGRRRHPMVVEIKTGVNKHGLLMAKDCRVVADGGAYNGHGPQIVAACVSWLTLVYRLEDFRFKGYHVYTNKPVASAMRGFGNTQVRYADDCQLDKIAKELGMDPLEIRLKNCRGPNEVTVQGAKITSCGLKECLEQVAEEVDFKAKWGKQPRLRGIGLACAAYVSGTKTFYPHDSSAAFIQVMEDGRVSLLVGAADIGQGSNTTLAQMAAEELGIALEDITVIAADTDVTPMDPGTCASRITFIAGNAVRVAAQDAKKQLAELAGEALEASPEDIEFKDRRVYVRGTPERAVPFADVVKGGLYSTRGMPVLGRGYYNPPSEFPSFKTGRGNRSPAYGFGAQAFEVEIDPDTGILKIIRAVAAQDCGRAINPMAVEGQIEGSISMGLGQAVYENLFYDNGQTLNPSLAEYRGVTALDVPPISTYLIETIDPEGPYGAKGISEMPLVPTSPALANALYDAIGVQIKSLPITPEKVLAALDQHQT
jgi:4-hydroxybenzoyl-CoA reductase subunit alpha